MKCEDVKELILTDYLDGQLEKEQKTQIEQHLTICSDCKEYELLTRTAVVEPFNNLENHNPPKATWNKIRGQIEEERPLHEPANSFTDLILRIKEFFYIPKSAFVVTSILVLLLVGITVIKLKPDDQKVVQVNPDSQIECINYLMTVFDQESANGNDDFGTSIEDYFL
ncbi:MAG: zf-HC2 domain-containing protein [Candidatus Scalindua sp.]|nr:zf-HC2 domain-containing protein [Candidatus Scalindua sp.]